MKRTWRRASSLVFSVAFGLSVSAGADAACTWRLFPTIDPEPSGNQLVAVAGAAANDVWEAGAAFHKTRSSGYALHWDGSRWKAFAQSDPGGHGGQFSALAALATDDVWAVGQHYAAPNYAARRAAAEHWNGSRFAVVPLPNVAGADTFLYALGAVAPNDIWAAGGSLTAGGLQATYVVHWDGNLWSQIAAPNVTHAATNLDSLAAISTDDVWTVGGSQANTSSPFRTLAEHWDGTRWSVVPTPNVNGNSNIFNAVVALARNDVWAVGDYNNGRAFTPLAEHWDGTSWQIVPTPNSGSRTAFVFGAAAVSTHHIWAVGEIAKSGGGVASYIMGWDGTHWAEVASPNFPHQLVTLLNGAAKIPGGTVWAVGGTANTKIVIHTVSEVRSCTNDRFPDDR